VTIIQYMVSTDQRKYSRPNGPDVRPYDVGVPFVILHVLLLAISQHSSTEHQTMYTETLFLIVNYPYKESPRSFDRLHIWANTSPKGRS